MLSDSATDLGNCGKGLKGIVFLEKIEDPIFSISVARGHIVLCRDFS